MTGGRWSVGIAFGLFALVSFRALGQTTADGSVQNGVYTNRYFKRSFVLPPWLHAIDFPAMLPKAGPSRNEVALMAARKSDAPFGMVMIAERLNVGTHPIVDEFDFLRRVRHGFVSGEQVIDQRGAITKAGPTFQILEYKVGAEFDAAVVSRDDAFLLVWRCNADSQADVDGMLSSITAMRVLP